MTREQADRIERKLNALCKAVGGPDLRAMDLAQPPKDSAQRTLAAIRKYAETLARSRSDTSLMHAETLLEILDAKQ